MPGPKRASRTATTKSKMAKKPAAKSKKMAAFGANGKRPKTNKPKRKVG